MNYRLKYQGFTLVELLVVISIIAILAGILLPTVVGAFKKASDAQVRTELKSIETAVKAYVNEYSKLPLEDGDQGDSPDVHLDTDAKSQLLIRKLVGENPRKIVFLEASTANGTFLDPWDVQYKMYLDSNYDNRVEFGTNRIYSQVVVYSTGSGTNIFSYR
jgi:prepilin-type N-terminal cleavage/methylation domain-containing protein